MERFREFRRGDTGTVEPVCEILDDEELAAGGKLNWRGGTGTRTPFSAPTLTPSFRGTREFPKPNEETFPYIRNRIVVNKPQKGPFKSLMEVDWTPTPEEIAEFGIPLLPMPLLELPVVENSLFDEDGDPRYAACTPPLMVSFSDPLRVSEEKTTAPTVDTEDIVSFGPDIHDISGNLR